MVLPGGKVIATKTLAIAGSALVAAAGVTVGVMLVLNGQKSYRNISVVDAIGGVAIFRKDVNDTFDAYKGMNLFAGDDVTVGADSELDMQLDNDKYVYIEENTHMWLEADGDEETSMTTIYLNEGAVLNRIDTKLNDKSYYIVETPNTTMSVRGTVVRVAVSTDEDGIVHTDFAVPEGNVSVQLHTVDGELVGEPLTIPQGFQCKTRGDEDFSEVVLQPVSDKDDNQEVVPIDLKELPPSTHQKLADIVMAGRPLYVGEREVLNDETHVFLLDPSEDVELEVVIEPTPEPTPETIADEPMPTPEPTKIPILEKIQRIFEPEPIITPEIIQLVSVIEEPQSETKEAEKAEDSTPTVTPTPTPRTYTVNFYEQGGTVLFGSQTVTEGNTVSRPLLKPYSGGGWYLDGSAYNFSDPVTGNINLVFQNDDGGS